MNSGSDSSHEPALQRLWSILIFVEINNGVSHGVVVYVHMSPIVINPRSGMGSVMSTPIGIRGDIGISAW